MSVTAMSVIGYNDHRFTLFAEHLHRYTREHLKATSISTGHPATAGMLMNKRDLDQTDRGKTRERDQHFKTGLSRQHFKASEAKAFPKGSKGHAECESDISIVVVDLLQELTDIDTLHESEEGAEVLIDALLEGQVVALMVQNMERLDETVKEEADGVYNTLGKSHTNQHAKMPFDANKLYCSEILAILLQNNDKLEAISGRSVLMNPAESSLTSVFKRHNPTTAEEQEMMENLFDALCSCLMLPANRDRFLRGEGLQLMNLMLREKKMSRVSALKVLDYGMIGPEGSDNCHKFVDILGLRTIFPLFMKTPKKMKKVGISDKEHEVVFGCICNVLTLVCSLLQVDRLMELHFKYLEAVQLADKRIEGEKHDMVRRGEIIDDAMDDEFYLRRLDAGLFVLQLVCYIMVEICNAGVPQLQQRVHQILNLRGGSVKIVRHIMREYAENIGDGKSEEFKESEQKRILELLENF
ncbi:beta-catenin-like protein 1 [Sinocyclocheilus grahami]|uniref:beta-catenin-like protein 1 n=1 Tax=Sinocyclocheilus grahami TaxID=75366 RepID=UPI0007AC8973|nr:PREDICTED: beta-catenin-like protein 1 [Sinocyclocheilus grahami]